MEKITHATKQTHTHTTVGRHRRNAGSTQCLRNGTMVRVNAVQGQPEGQLKSVLPNESGGPNNCNQKGTAKCLKGSHRWSAGAQITFNRQIDRSQPFSNKPKQALMRSLAGSEPKVSNGEASAGTLKLMGDVGARRVPSEMSNCQNTPVLGRNNQSHAR